ncbi:MAG TPA: 50S ribosomal protein L31 [Oligoflexia bacterium]|nr:50S ribosomal protein L31 [Oligoflexia bacterium]HMP27637.1 50S ribosomal protein L31 [Oligoflexia bacterium]
MKKGIHPEYHQTEITCIGCNTTFLAGSTAKEIRVTICSNCHPFYTGQEKIIDTEGRVDKFKKKFAGRYGTTSATPTNANQAK